ncbi:hypothetical protein MKAN_22305 [Mycobacterium kansasii ATCC 12478]|nr:hypothetical protein MKAN_22305 [Mycobacterium kansasii ATCC 12478]
MCRRAVGPRPAHAVALVDLELDGTREQLNEVVG